MTVEEEKSKKAEEQIKRNYERLLYAIAVLYRNDLDIDVTQQDDYSKLTEAQKTFSKKIYDKYDDLQKQVEQDKRISEETITRDIAKISQKEDEGDLKKIITAGNDRVCPKCQKWNEKIISLSGKSIQYPSLETAIKDGFLHYNCQCYLADVDIKEIERKAPNPRASYQTKQRHPEAYNQSSNRKVIVSNCFFEINI